MASKEVKVALKAAREAINAKAFKEVLKHCKAVLQADKENYTAWVFIGLAAGELEQPEKAEDSFRRAASIDPAQPLAWQGLASLCEKTEQPHFKQALPAVYEKLLSIFEGSDRAKWCDICKKLAETLEAQQRADEAVRAWARLYEWKRGQDGADDTEPRALWGRATSALTRAVAAGPASDALESAFERLLELASDAAARSDHEKLLVDYITFLSKRAGAEERLRETCTAALATDGAGRALLERVATVYIGADDAGDAAVSCYERLLTAAPHSAAARVGLALREMRERRYGDARDTLRRVSGEEPGFLPAWRHLSDVLLRTHDHDAAASAAERALQLLKKREADSVANGPERRALLRIRAEALTERGTEEAVAIYTELLAEAPADADLRVGLADTFLKAKRLPEARQIVEELQASAPDSTAVLALRGRLALEEGDLALAESCSRSALAMEPESGLLLLQLGLVMWEAGGEARTDKANACAHFLQAARRDPFLGAAFLQLGLFYRDVAGDLGRARGCFRRALELSPGEPRAGAGAVDCSVALGDEDTALQILSAVTERAAAGSAQWAWLRLGLYHLRQRDHPHAITCLQSALRAEPRDAVGWECLGEAYLARGAYTAAGKAFARSAELAPGPQSVYSRYQTAAIRQALGSHAEAVRLYQQLLRDDPTHVPGLKGLAESHLALARAALSDHLDGRAVSHAQEALVALASAVVLRRDFSCIWKLLGDACTVLHGLHPAGASLAVPTVLLGPSDPDDVEDMAGTTTVLGKLATLELGARCYGRAVHFLPCCSGLWHDLGINCYCQAQHLRQEAARGPDTELAQEGDGGAKAALDKALQYLKKAVTLDSADHRHWNALGVVAASEGVGNDALAQHAFIKSIRAEPNNVVAWTHLGALYLGKGSVELAHEAFKVAQSLEPSYVACWIGQALIAETIGSDEAMDLFRHTTELGVHVEGALGYVHWVCTTLRQQAAAAAAPGGAAAPVSYSVERMGAVPSAHQAACKYIERYPEDAVALTMLGTLSEHLELHRQAVDAYRRAMEVIRSLGDEDKMSYALRNYGRALHAAGRYEEAAATFGVVPPSLAHFDDVTGLALALFKLGKLKESYAAYERALAAAASDADRAVVLTALAAVEFRRGRHDAAKTLLFRCSLSQQPCEEGLLALCALGLALGDPTLSAAALSELAKPRVAAGRGVAGSRGGRGAARASRVSLLTVALLALRGDGVAVQRQASKAVHRNPGDASLWEFLARVVPQFTPNKAKGGATAAQVATILDFSVAKRAPRYHAVNLLAGGSGLRGLKASQRAVHLYPDDASGWACVLAASHADAVRRWADATAPRSRPGLSDAVLDVVAARVNGGGLEAGLRDLGGWVHCQAASAELWEGRNKAALRACFKGLESLGEDDGARATLGFVAALVRFCEAMSSGRSWAGALEDLRAAALDTASPYAWQVLAGVYTRAGRALAAEVSYRHGLQVAARVGDFSGKVSSLLRLAHLAVVIVAAGVKEERWAPLAQEALATLAKAAPGEAVTRLLQGALPFCTNPGARQTRKALERAARGAGTEASIARCLLVRHLLLKSDDHLLQILLEDVKALGDTRTLSLHARLSAGS